MFKKVICFLLTVAVIISFGGVEAAKISLTLDEAVALALRNNRAIEQSAEDREAARWALSEVRRNSGLTLSWSTTLSRIGGRWYNRQREAHYQTRYLADTGQNVDQQGNKINPKMYPSYQSEMVNTFSLRMPLYSGGRLENSREAARYGLNAADMNLENTRQQVKYQTAVAYYQVLARAALVQVQQEAVRLLEEHLRNVEIQYEVGVVAKADMLATNVQLANVQRALNSAWGDYLTVVAQLNNLMGVAVDTEVELSEETNFSSDYLTEAECLEYALAHRPDGISARYLVKRAAAAKDAAKSGYRPTVAAVIQGIFGGEGNFTADHYQERWTVGLEMQWNIFDNGITSSRVEQAKAAERKAESQARQQLEAIELEVRSAYIALQTAEKNIETTSAAVSKAEEEFAIAQIRYIEGVDTNLNVMDAQEKVVETRNNFYSAVYDYNASRARLDKAMGIPVETDADTYVEAERAGNSSRRGLEAARIVTRAVDDVGEPFK